MNQREIQSLNYAIGYVFFKEQNISLFTLLIILSVSYCIWKTF
jgi:hypothetical protein